MIYLFLFIVLLFGCLHNWEKHPQKKKLYFYFEYIVIVLTFGLRYKVGGDTINYYYTFQDSPTLVELFRYGNDSIKYNIGWVFLTALSKQIWNNFAAVQIIQSSIVNAAFFYFFKKYSSNYFTAIFLYGLMYMLTFNTELMRASLAISIFLFGFSFYLNKRWLQYYLLAFVALLFHNEAVLMFILPICYPLSKIRPNVSTLLLIFLISVAVVTSLNFVPQLLSLLSTSERILATFLLYSDTNFQANLNGFIGQTIILSPWFFLLWLSRKEQNLFWRGFIILFIFFGYQQLKYLEFMKRACDFLYPFTILALAYGLRRFKYTRNDLIKVGIALSTLIAVYVRINSFVANNHHKLFYPYTTIFFPEENQEREDLVYEFQGLEIP